MPRCVTCDSCSEIDGTSPHLYRWSDKDNGYVCSVCRRYSFHEYDWNEVLGKLNGEVPILDEQNNDLEGFEVLVESRVETDKSDSG